MYSEEWEEAMVADSMEERIRELSILAQQRAKQRDESIQDVVYNMAHDSYLQKHTTGDVLQELRELQELYPDEFYNGSANDHIMFYLQETSESEFWHDHLFLALAAGLEWAILQDIEERATAE